MRQVQNEAKSGLTPTIFGIFRQKYQQLWSSLGRTLKGLKEPNETKSAEIEGRRPQRRTLERRLRLLEAENEVLQEWVSEQPVRQPDDVSDISWRRMLMKRIRLLEAENAGLRELHRCYEAKFERQRHLIQEFNADRHRLARRLRRLENA